MRALLLLSLVSATAVAQRGGGRFDRFNSRCIGGRTDRGLPCETPALVEFAPASGAGMGSACACANITGAKGEVVTAARLSTATCRPLGAATTGIATASLVECGANLPRVGVDQGALALNQEDTAINLLPRFIDYANALWADVGTPSLTGAQPSPWSGTYANLAVQFDDNDPAAFEGRAQAVTVVAATQHTMCCYARAGTLSTARLSLDGTTADFTGLSTTTSTLISVTDASSSGVSISAQALNGNTAASTGTVVWGGCQVEVGPACTSMIPTVASAAARAGESAYAAVSINKVTNEYSMAATVTVGKPASGLYLITGLYTGTTTPWSVAYSQSGTSFCESFNATFVQATAASPAPGSYRVNCFNDLSNEQGTVNGVTRTPAAGGRTVPAGTRIYFGNDASGTLGINGWISRVCFDLSGSRCR